MVGEAKHYSDVVFWPSFLPIPSYPFKSRGMEGQGEGGAGGGERQNRIPTWYSLALSGRTWKRAVNMQQHRQNKGKTKAKQNRQNKRQNKGKTTQAKQNRQNKGKTRFRRGAFWPTLPLRNKRDSAIWVSFIPAKLAWLIQPCDTHCFAKYKRSLRDQYHREALRNAGGAVSTKQIILHIDHAIKNSVAGHALGSRI